MNLGNYDTALLECAMSNFDVFSTSRAGDVCMYPSRNAQDILIGTDLDTTPCLTVHGNNLGVGTNNPLTKLHVFGHSTFDGVVELKSSVLATGTTLFHSDLVPAGGIHINTRGVHFNTLADSRFLEFDGIVSNASALDTLVSIPVRKLRPLGGAVGSGTEGCLANELEVIYPSCVTGEFGDQVPQMIDYAKLVPLMIAAIKELRDRIP